MNAWWWMEEKAARHSKERVGVWRLAAVPLVHEPNSDSLAMLGANYIFPLPR